MKYEKRNDLITMLASSCVVISFFLPWVGRLTGPNIVSYSMKAFDMSSWSNEWIIIGTFIMGQQIIALIHQSVSFNTTTV